MNIVFRVDSSNVIGTGHVMRCLTLAQQLKNCQVSFICRKLDGNIIEQIKKLNFSVYEIDYQSAPTQKIEDLNPEWEKDAALCKAILEKASPIDLLIVDHYALDEKWEKALADKSKSIFVIDDLANRKHFCQILLDQNYYSNLQTRYSLTIPNNCKLLLGPQYALLKPEFNKQRNQSRRNFFKKPSRMSIFYGGADHTGETLKALYALERFLYLPYEVDVVVGVANTQRDAIVKKAKSLSVNCLDFVENMAEHFSKADFALGAGGTTTWERCCLGLPSIVTSIADNQIAINKDLDSFGAVHYLGISKSVTPETIYKALKLYHQNPHQLKSLSEKSLQLVDGLGVERVIKEIL